MPENLPPMEYPRASVLIRMDKALRPREDKYRSTLQINPPQNIRTEIAIDTAEVHHEGNRVTVGARYSIITEGVDITSVVEEGWVIVQGTIIPGKGRSSLSNTDTVTVVIPDALLEEITSLKSKSKAFGEGEVDLAKEIECLTVLGII